MSNYPTPKTKCRGCNHPITWEAQRRQYGRLVRRGFEPAEVKPILPRCQKCVTRWLRDRAAAMLDGATDTAMTELPTMGATPPVHRVLSERCAEVFPSSVRLLHT